MQLNINVDRFWCDGLVTNAPSLEGCRVKEFPEDFHVFEIPYNQDCISAGEPLALSDLLINCLEDTRSTAPLVLLPQDCRFAIATSNPEANAELAPSAPFNIEDFLRPHEEALGSLNDWVLEMPQEVTSLTETCKSKEAVTLIMPASKDDRRTVYEIIEIKYPYLKVTLVGSSTGKGAPRGEAREARVAPAAQLLDIRRAGMPWEDCMSVQRFYSRGPLHPEAHLGLAVGAGLDKSQRTAVYRLLASIYNKLDSKTVDAKRETGGKELRLYWRRNAVEQASYMQRGRVVDRPREGGSKRCNNEVSSTVVVSWDSLRQALVSQVSSELSTEGLDEKEPSSKRQRIDPSCSIPPDSSLHIAGLSASSSIERGLARARVLLPRYLSFVLVKYNVEQTDAFTALAGLLGNLAHKASGTSPNAFPTGLVASSYLRSFTSSGVKDRRGLTAQRCCVEILPAWVNLYGGSDDSNRAIADDSPFSSSSFIGCALASGQFDASLLPPEQRHQAALLTAAAAELISGNKATINAVGSVDKDATLGQSISSFVHGLVRRGQGIFVADVRACQEPLQMGQHWGNRFKVVIRNIGICGISDGATRLAEGCADVDGADEVKQLLQRRMDVISAIGFPNFFGSQRFGYVSKYSATPDPNSNVSVSTSTPKLMVPQSHGDEEVAILLSSEDIPEKDAAPDDSLEADQEEPGGDEKHSNHIASVISDSQVPVGPRIGKSLILGDWITAVHALVLGDRFDHFATLSTKEEDEREADKYGETDSIDAVNNKGTHVKLSGLERARRLYAVGARPSEVLRWVPSTMVRERWVLQGLVRHGGNRNVFKRVNLPARMNIDGASKSSSCPCCSCCGVSPNGVDADSSRLRECDVQISHRRAIETIPYGARLIWVHAYQSWLWNKVASRRLFISDSIQQAGEPRLGDLLDLQLLDPAQRSALSSHQIVDIGSDSTRNVIEIDDIALQTLSTAKSSKLSFAITLPLIGTHVIFPSSDGGRFYYDLLLSEGFDLSQGTDPARPWAGFRLKPSGGMPLKGAYRNVLQTLGDKYSVTVSAASSAVSTCSGGFVPRVSAEMEFDLPSGSYATVLLREVLRSDDF